MPTLVCLFSIHSSFFFIQAMRREGKEEEKEKKSRCGNLFRFVYGKYEFVG